MNKSKKIKIPFNTTTLLRVIFLIILPFFVFERYYEWLYTLGVGTFIAGTVILQLRKEAKTKSEKLTPLMLDLNPFNFSGYKGETMNVFEVTPPITYDEVKTMGLNDLDMFNELKDGTMEKAIYDESKQRYHLIKYMELTNLNDILKTVIKEKGNL